MSTSATTATPFAETSDPFALFATWMADADKSEPNDPNAMALSTVDPDGLPNVRMVLLKRRLSAVKTCPLIISAHGAVLRLEEAGPSYWAGMRSPKLSTDPEPAL